jgi:hypothetical protein
MTTDLNPDVLRRIKKCLALSASSNEHEAAAAMRQAQKLMAAHNVTLEGLAASEVQKHAVNAYGQRQVAGWQLQLAALVGKSFGCELYITHGIVAPVRYGGCPSQIVYIGIAHNAQIAAYTFEVLLRQALKARAKFMAEYAEGAGKWDSRGEKVAAGETFCRGYVSNVARQVSELALTDTQRKAIEARKEQELGPGAGVFKPTARAHNSAAYEAGRAAGADAALHRPMPGAGPAPLQLTN